MSENLAQISDPILVQRVQQGDRAAFDTLVERYYGKVYSSVRGKLGFPLTDAALEVEDVVQEVFLAAYQNLSQLRKAEAFPGWLYTLTLNTCRKIRKAQSRQAIVDPMEEGTPTPGPSLEEQVTEGEFHREVVLAFNTLPEIYRIPLTLFYLDDCSYGEIAAFLGRPLGTVKRQLHQGREMLRRKMGDMIP